MIAIGALSGAAAVQHARSGSGVAGIDHWREIAWPFPRDGWPAGRAFRCDAAACGEDVELYVRPKIGFCNCDSGVADDDEVDRVADLDLMSQRFAPLEAGRVVRIAEMSGRSRSYDLAMADGSSMPRSGSRSRGAAIFWSRWRKAKAMRLECSASRPISSARTPWRAG